jgi:hypothetical protein
LARLVPELFEGLSLSTYEGYPTFPFQVVGTLAPEPGMLGCSLEPNGELDDVARETLERLLSRDVDVNGVRLCNLAHRVAVRLPGEPRGEMWNLAQRIVELRREGEVSDSSVRDLFGNPDVLLYLAGAEPGLRAIAGAALEGTPPVLRAIQAVVPQVDVVAQETLCAAIADRYASTAQLAGCAAVAAALPEGAARERMLDAILSTALRDELAAKRLQGEDAPLVVAQAARRQLDLGAVETLLRATARHVSRCAAVQSIPDSYLSFMFKAALDDDRSPPGLFAVFLARPTLLRGAELDDATKGRCMDLLERVDQANGAAALTALLPHLVASPTEQRLRAVLSVLGPIAAGRSVAAVPAAADRPGTSPALNRIRDEIAALLLAQSEAKLALVLLGRSASKDAKLASGLVRRLDDCSSESATDVAWRAGKIERIELREGVTDVALAAAVEEATRIADVGRVWFALGDVQQTTNKSMLLRQLLHYAVDCPRDPSGAIVLAWIAQARPPLLSRGGHLKDDEAEELALALSALVPEWRLSSMEPSTEDAGRRGRRWWRRLEAHRKKQIRRERKASL